MGIDALEHKRHQPFYNALLSDGFRRYVAQENIQVLYREFRRPGSPATTADQTPTPSRDPQVATAPSTTTSGASQLQFSELGPLGIEAVGQYFEAWDGQRGHYIMNKELRKVYPTEDYQ